MNISFTSGSGFQKGVVSSVAEGLLGLPSEAIPVAIEVSFEGDPDPSQHNEFAVSEYSYDEGTATMAIKSVAPKFGGPYSSVEFFREVVAHELGHIIFANIGSTYRLQIVEMFGGDTDDLSVINNPTLNWKDRIIEGVAETFKDAFLRPSLRIYGNRTNRKIPIYQYEQFRALFREAIPAIPSVGGRTTLILDELNSNELSARTFFWLWVSAIGVSGRGGTLEVEVEDDHTFEFSMSVPRNWFSATLPAYPPLEEGDDFAFAFRAIDKDTREVYAFHRGWWTLANASRATYETRFFPVSWLDSLFSFGNSGTGESLASGEDGSEGGNNNWILYGEDAVSLGGAPFTMNVRFSVPGGSTVIFQATAFLQSIAKLSGEYTGDLQADVAGVLPDLPYTIGASPGGAEIKLRGSTAIPGSVGTGRRSKRRTIVGTQL